MVPRGCRVSSRGKLTLGPGSSLPGSTRQRIAGKQPGLSSPSPTWAPGRSPLHFAPHRGSLAAHPARCQSGARNAFQLETPPPPDRSPGQRWDGGRWGEGRRGGLGRKRSSSPCCVTLGRFPALSGLRCCKWQHLKLIKPAVITPVSLRSL